MINLHNITNFMNQSIRTKSIPGALLRIHSPEITDYTGIFGAKQLQPTPSPMTLDTLFDLASLTKVIATWPAILQIINQYNLDMHAPLKNIAPLFHNSTLRNCTLVQLLTHTAGLRQSTYAEQYGPGQTAVIHGMLTAPLEYIPGEHVAYCSRGFILLAHIVELFSGQRFDDYVRERVWQPLGMNDTYFVVPESLRAKAAPTEFNPATNSFIRGTVHDESARWLNGIAGHAGAFSTLEDIAIFCNMLLTGGTISGKRIIDGELLCESFKNHTLGLEEARGYAWKNYTEFARDGRLFGHNGFTGTSIFIDISRGRFVILLSNRIHPARSQHLEGINSVREFLMRECWQD